MSSPIQLPPEIWSLILLDQSTNQTLTLADLWLRIRPVNTLLYDIITTHFRSKILPVAQLRLPILLPSYDVRNPGKGVATFGFGTLPSFSPSSSSNGQREVIFELLGTEPEIHREGFAARWKRNANSPTHQEALGDRRGWEMRLPFSLASSVDAEGRRFDGGDDIEVVSSVGVRLRHARAVVRGEAKNLSSAGGFARSQEESEEGEEGAGGVMLSFEWMATFSCFFKELELGSE